MASVVLRTAGAAAGNALLPGIGGAFLGNLGRSFGGIIDGQLGLGAHYAGPRIDNLAVQDSRYGAGIPIVYGRARVAGNVIWSTDLIETQHDSSFSGGKGGGLSGSSTSQTTYSYSVHCAVGICAGSIGGINTIWADSKIIYQNGVWVAGVADSATIYLGDGAQTPDAFMESILGGGNVPGYRGLAYVVFDNLQLANFGNRLPNLTFEILPVASTSEPFWLGSVDAGIDQRPQVAQSGGMLPLPLTGSGSEVRSVIAGGFNASGSDFVFEVAEYDVTDKAPVELARTQSGIFSTQPGDCSWDMAPDQRYVAMYVQNATTTNYFVIYDSAARQFGSVFSATLNLGSSDTKKIAWIDPQHFVIDDISGGVRGLRVFARAGLNIIDLGFFGVWGSGSATACGNFYYAQFTPFAGGLLNYVCDFAIPNVLTMYVRPIAWRNNALAVGDAYTLVSGLALDYGSGEHANFVRTGDSEWTLCYGSVIGYRMFSFEPDAASAAITRPWQAFSLSFGTGSTNFPLYYGDRLVIVQRGVIDSSYRLSEVTLDAGGYTRVLDAAVIAGSPAANEFCALPIDSGRFLLQAVGGFDYDIAQLGLVQRRLTGDSLEDIVGDILARAGYASGDYDLSELSAVSVDGYVLQEPTTARMAIEPLQVFSPFDLVESVDQLMAVPRGSGADITLPSSEWRAAQDKKEPPAPIEMTRTQEMDLPVEVDIDYIDAARDFEANSQRARRIATTAKTVQKVALPIVCTASAAKQIAETRLYTLWAQRTLARIFLSRKYLALEPGDVADLGDGNLLRVTSLRQAGGLLQAEGFFTYAAAGSSAASADAGASGGGFGIAPLSSTLYLMDLPLLQSSDDQPGVYAAASGLPGWTGATLWRASDGVNYSNIARLPSMAIAGFAVTAPQNVPCDYMDRISTVEVQLMNGSLSSCSEGDLYNGANAALLGSEIIQFETATLVGPGLYTLSNLLRGRRGTEFAASSHSAGETFVMLTSGPVVFVPALQTDRGSAYEFRALSRGQSLGSAQDQDFTYSLNTLKPFSPANVQGSRASGTGSDLTIGWKRRARLDAEWVSNIDVPLDEPSELYDLEVMNGGSVVRTFSSITSPTQVYTAAQQSSDWGTVPASFTVNIYQISARYGRGQPATAVI